MTALDQAKTAEIGVESQKYGYTIKETAIRLNMSEKSVRRLIQRGYLRRCKVFGRVLIPRKDVDTFFEKFSGYGN